MDFKLTPKQEIFFNAVFSGEYKYLLYGGAIRGAKTWAALFLLYTLCKVYPGSRWAIVRKDLPTLRRNTIPSFDKTRPTNFIGKVNQSTWTARCANGSEIIFFSESFDTDKDLDRWKGLEINGFILEEMNELNALAFEKAIERAGSWIIQGANKQPPPLIIGTCNPSNNWVKTLFYDKWKANTLEKPYYYLPAKVTDNPYLPKAYLESLAELEKKNPEFYDRFVNGNWELSDDPWALIKYEWLTRALSADRVPGPGCLGVDVGHTGPDKSVWAYRVGNALKSIYMINKTSVPDVVRTTKIKATELAVNATEIRVDGVGIGAGVVDYLHDEGWEVFNVMSGGKAIARKKSVYQYRNIRSQLWWEFREMLREGIISFDFEDLELFADLTALRYEIKGDKMIQVESKEDLKKRIGRSPDKGDAVAYAFFDTTPEKTPFCFA